MTWFFSPWLLLAWGGFVRWVAPTPREDERWSTRVDVPLAIGAGVAFAAMTGLWFPDYFLLRWPLTASDFPQYCESVASVAAGRPDLVHPQRSMFAALLPGALARTYGIVGGLAIASLLSQAIAGAALFLWGRAAAGRMGGFLVVLLGACMGPLVFLARTTTFYPESVAAMVVASAGAALALRYRTVPGFLAAGVGVGLALLADPRGLYWALSVGGASLAATFFPSVRGSGRVARTLVSMAALAAPLVASWAVASALARPGAVGLVMQTSAFVGDAVIPLGLPAPDGGGAAEFVWGSSPLANVPEVLARVRELMALVPEGIADSREVLHGRRAHVLPWMGPAATAGLLGILGLWRRPWALLAWVVPAIPFALSLYTASHSLSYTRYFSLGFPGVAVVLGVGVAVALRRSTGLVPERWRPPASLGVIVLLVFGVVPTWLSPIAPWRLQFSAEQDPRYIMTAVTLPDPTYFLCFTALQEDVAQGRTWSGYEGM